jgi:predicted dehydrogenase
VLIEKPFTMNADEAADLLARATRHRLKITVDHNFQFTGPALRARALIEEGFLGRPLVHLESYYCYDLSDASYAKAFLTDTGHWVRTLPGGLLQNVISHGIGKLAEHLTSDSPVVIARAFTSPLLKGLGEQSVLDELRVMIHDDSTTAYFTFSSQMRPQVFQLRLFGPKNGLFIDENHHVVVKLRGRKYKSYLDNIVPPLELASQYMKSAASNIYGLFSHRLNMNEGMKELIERFHRSIREDGPVPIPYREILITSRIMDAILLQINQGHEQPGLVGPTVAS